jgi:hypothetical protein
MKILFLDANNEPVSYTLDPQKEIWQQSAGNKKIPIRNVIFWDRVAFIGGVLSVADKCEVQIEPTSGNLNTICVRYVVKKAGIEYVGFGSANDYSVIKTEKEIIDWNTKKPIVGSDGKPKYNVSGSARYAAEMAVKRAKNNAVAAALRLTNDAAPDYEESLDFILDPELKNKITKNYKAPDLTITPMDDEPEDHDHAPQPPARPQTPPVSAQKPAAAPAPVAPKPPEKPAEKPASPPAPKSPPAGAVADPDSFKIEFGKHKGKTMLQVLHEDASYIEWLAKESNRDNVKSAAMALLDKYQDLAKIKGGGPKNNPTDAGGDGKTHSHSAESETHKQLRNFWASRKYSNLEAKAIIAQFLAKADITWGQVTTEEAERMYKEKEQLFPPKPQEPTQPPFEAVTTAPAAKTDDTAVRKCAACGNDLVTMEITFSEKYKDKYKGHYFCFEHQSNEEAISKVLSGK